MPRRAWLPHVSAVVGYTLLAIAFTWPLASHLSTHLTSPPDGDAAVYVWNQWVFQHELVELRTNPYFTDTIFAPSGGVNLSLHNYTAFNNLLALPFTSGLGRIATFNLTYLFATIVTAWAMFVLVRSMTGAGFESWLAGALFAWAPWFVTRSNGQFSLIAAAPLPIFLWLLHRTAARRRTADAFMMGVTLAWAFACDVYYAVFCVIIAAVYVGVLAMRIVPTAGPDRSRASVVTLDSLLIAAAVIVLSVMLSGGTRVVVLDTAISIRSLYTPVLILTIVALVRVGIGYRAEWLATASGVRRFFVLAFWMTVPAAVLLSPVLYAIGLRIVDGTFDMPATYWRSSPSGVDLLAFLIPNPNHPLAPAQLGEWLKPPPGAELENVASVSCVALLVMLVAWLKGWRAPTLWTSTAIAFVLLSLGPFIHVAGVNTHIPGPWALLRYVPVLGFARSPSRQAVLVMLAVALLFALALQWLSARSGRRRPVVLAGIACLLAFELLPAPRPLYSAAVPSVYEVIAADPRPDITVMELPLGISDGASSVGNFSASAQFYQTIHHKRIVGGALSRVSRRRLAENTLAPVRGALISLSEGQTLSETKEQSAIADAPLFVKDSRLAYVVVNRRRTSLTLLEFAIRAFQLTHVATDGDLDLYVPGAEVMPKEVVQNR